MLSRDIIYLKQILDCINDIESFVEGYSEEAFVNDKKTFNSCIRMFEVVGEATKRLSQEFKDQYPDVEWRKMAGLRDVLIHDYEGVNLNAVWKIIQLNIPTLKTQIQTIIQNHKS